MKTNTEKSLEAIIKNQKIIINRLDILNKFAKELVSVNKSLDDETNRAEYGKVTENDRN